VRCTAIAPQLHRCTVRRDWPSQRPKTNPFMQNKPNDGPGATARAEQTIKFADLTSAQKRKVEAKAEPGFYKTAAFKKQSAAAREAHIAYRAVLTRLGNEPLTTGALFLVAGAFLELASTIVGKIGDVAKQRTWAKLMIPVGLRTAHRRLRGGLLMLTSRRARALTGMLVMRKWFLFWEST
jgi:hypothetical protein